MEDIFIWFIIGMILISYAMCVVGLIYFTLWIFLKKGGLWELMIFRARGGSMVIKAFPDNTVDFKRYKNSPQTIDFETKDRAGRKKKYLIQIAGVKHMLHGTSNPVHICPFNSHTNTSMIDSKHSEFSIQQLNEFAIMNYETGWNARGALQGKNPFNIENLQLLLLVIVVGALLVNAYFTYQVLIQTSPIPTG